MLKKLINTTATVIYTDDTLLTTLFYISSILIMVIKS